MWLLVKEEKAGCISVSGPVRCELYDELVAMRSKKDSKFYLQRTSI